MKFSKQAQTLPIINHDHQIDTKILAKHSSSLFGTTTKRCLIVGRSGCGKTNLLISLLLHPNGMRFTHLYIYCKSLDQPKYAFLKQLFTKSAVGFNEFVLDSDLPKPCEAKKWSIIIFDDVICHGQSVIRDYFCFGRHRSIDCFYLAQTYSSVPKQLIRDNANLIVLFQQDNRNLRHLYNDHVTIDMSFEAFRRLCSACWQDPYGVLVIDKDSPLNHGRYRKGFDVYIGLTS